MRRRQHAIRLRPDADLPPVLDPANCRAHLEREASAMLAEWYRERGVTPWVLDHYGPTPTTLTESEPTVRMRP